LAIVVTVAVSTAAGAQDRDARAELAQRGAPPAFVDPIVDHVAMTRRAGLPVGPVIDKALEGWAKRVAVQRVTAALEQIRTRLAAGREALVAAGQPSPPDAVIVGAAEALSRGLSADEVGQIAGAAPDPEIAGAGLTVAASLRAQGLEGRAAVRAVVDAYGRTESPAQLFELPSAVADLRGRGLAMGDVARRIMEGGGLPLPPMAGAGQGPGQGRPGSVPPGPGGQQGQGKRGRQ
jgi:hypothetical protein